MFTKVLIVCAVAAVALGIEYPPGLNPVLCPNYPYCDMELLARYTPQVLPIPSWELPYYARFAPYAFAPIPTAPIAVADSLPVTTDAAIAAPLPETDVGEAPKYPADFDPALCPNYPFCN